MYVIAIDMKFHLLFFPGIFFNAKEIWLEEGGGQEISTL